MSYTTALFLDNKEKNLKYMQFWNNSNLCLTSKKSQVLLHISKLFIKSRTFPFCQFYLNSLCSIYWPEWKLMYHLQDYTTLIHFQFLQFKPPLILPDSWKEFNLKGSEHFHKIL